MNIESFLRAKPNTSKRNKFYSGKYENFEKIFGKNNFNDLKASSFRGNTANKEGQRWKDNSLQPVKKHLTRKWVQIIRKNSVFPNIQNQISLKTYEKGKEKWKNLRNVVKKPKDFPIKIKEKINQSMVEEILKDIEGIESAYSQRLSQRLDD